MRANWANIPLGEILTERKETPSMDAILAGEIPIVSKISFDSGQIELRDSPDTRTGMILIRPGDLVLSGINAAKGAIAIYNDGNRFPIAATIHYGAYIPNRDRVDIRYLWWFFRSRGFRQILTWYVPGGIKTELKSKRLLPVPIPLPPLSEQRRIVAKIERLAANINEAHGLMQRSDHDVDHLVGSYTHHLFSEELRGKVTTMPLGDISEIRSGVTLGRRLTGRTLDLPYLRVANVQDGYLDLGHIKTVTIRLAEQDKWQLEDGDLLLTEGGDWDKLGRGTIWHNEIPDCIHQNHIFRVRLNQNEFDPNYVLTLVRSPYGKEYFQDASKQTTNLASINQRQLKAFPVYRLPLEEQYRIVDYLDGLQEKVNSLKQLQEQTSAELDALLPSILDKAFKGEL